MVDAVVVGSGPNGLAAALVMVAAGLSVEVYEAAGTLGGGCRTAELTLPGFQHDSCAGAHPLAVASPFFRAFDLGAHGVQLDSPEASYAHPLDGGRAGVAWRDLDRTVAELGRDGSAWRRFFGPLTRRWQHVVELATSDLRSLPRHPVAAAQFGRRLVEQSTPLWRNRFHDEVASALLAGVGAHSMLPPPAPASAGVALLLGTAAHVGGWPVVRGGSQGIVDALVAAIVRHGGKVFTERRVDCLKEFSDARAIVLDVAPAELLRVAGDRLPQRIAKQLRRFRYGSAACKVDYALREPVPWQASGCKSAGTLHVIGTRAEIVTAERAIAAGRVPQRPFVLVIQPGVVDPSRAPAGSHTLYTYAHVPHGCPVDVTALITTQIERFAPGFRDTILARTVRTAADMPAYNPNYVGGDIAAGAMTARQMLFRPTASPNPYATGLPGVYLCSSATPPGPGVHGMCGLHAATHALRERFGIRCDSFAQLRLADHDDAK